MFESCVSACCSAASLLCLAVLPLPRGSGTKSARTLRPSASGQWYPNHICLSQAYLPIYQPIPSIPAHIPTYPNHTCPYTNHTCPCYPYDPRDPGASHPLYLPANTHLHCHVAICLISDHNPERRRTACTCAANPHGVHTSSTRPTLTNYMVLCV